MIMNEKDVKIGDKVCDKTDKFPMIVVGIFTTLYDMDNATLYLDFEGNEGDVFEADLKDIEPYVEE